MVRCNRLPKVVTSKYMNKDGTSTNDDSKESMYMQPILMVKTNKESEVGGKYEQVYTITQYKPSR